MSKWVRGLSEIYLFEETVAGHKIYDASFVRYRTYAAIKQDIIITAAIVTSGEKLYGK